MNDDGERGVQSGRGEEMRSELHRIQKHLFSYCFQVVEWNTQETLALQVRCTVLGEGGIEAILPEEFRFSLRTSRL